MKRHFLEKYGYFYSLLFTYWCAMVVLQYPPLPSLTVSLVPSVAFFLLYSSVRQRLSSTDVRSFILSLLIISAFIVFSLAIVSGNKDPLASKLLVALGIVAIFALTSTLAFISHQILLRLMQTR